MFQQEGTFYFHLTPQQATDIAMNRDLRNQNKPEYLIQVQLRFCLLETTCEQEVLKFSFNIRNHYIFINLITSGLFPTECSIKSQRKNVSAAGTLKNLVHSFVSLTSNIFQNPIATNKPGVEPKRPPRPVNITMHVKISPTVANGKKKFFISTKRH